MLQNLREHAQGWIAYVIAGVLCLAFALFGIQYYIGNSSSEVIVAKVNGEDITQTQLDNTYQRLRQAVNSSADSDSAFQQQLKTQALKGLVQEQVLAQAAAKAGYTLSDAQVNAIVRQIPAFQANQLFSPSLFQQTLQAMSYTLPSFIQSIRQQSTMTQVQNGLSYSAFALPGEIAQNIALQNQLRDFGYLLIPNTPSKTLPSETDINNYYKSHTDDFITPEQFSLQYILLSADAADASVTVTDQEAQQYYQDHMAAFSTGEQWQIAQITINIAQGADKKAQQAATQKVKTIVDQLKSGDEFANVAKQLSDDTQTAQNGGLVGWVTSDTHTNSAILQAAMSLKVNQVSAPVLTDSGWAIVKLLAATPAKAYPFNSVEAQIKKDLRTQKIEQLLSKQSDELTQLTYTQPNTLQPAADELKLTIKTTPLFTRTSEKTGILANPKVWAAAFSNNVLQQGNNSDVIALDGDTLAVIRIADHKLAATEPLPKVRAAIITRLQKQAADQAAGTLGEKITQALRQGGSPGEIAQTHHLHWVDETAVSRQNSTVPQQVLQLAFATPPDLKQSFSVQGTALPNGDYAIVKLNKVTNGSSSNIEDSAKTATKNQIIGMFANTYYDMYIAYETQKASIKYE